MIRVTRGETPKGRYAYKIFIDDICRGKIKEHETKEFEVENGDHIVYAKINWCRSNKLEVNVSDSVVNLEVGCSLDGPKWVPLEKHLLYSLFYSDEFLWIAKK